MIDYIDPKGELIQHRFFRPHCILQDDVYVKDLRIFKNVHLKDILIVDNAVYSFGDQIDNGIPITPFKEDPRDTEFLNLIKYLERCADVPDVREINKKAFQLRRIFRFNLEPFIKYYDFEECERLLQEEDLKKDDSPNEPRSSPISIASNQQKRRVKRPPKSVNDQLDILAKYMAKNGGKLPVQ